MEKIVATKKVEQDTIGLFHGHPEEHVDYETAMDVVRKFCDEVLKDYECVYSAHTDQAHTHCHIVFNSVNYTNGKKFRYEDGDWLKCFNRNWINYAKKKDSTL